MFTILQAQMGVSTKKSEETEETSEKPAVNLVDLRKRLERIRNATAANNWEANSPHLLYFLVYSVSYNRVIVKLYPALDHEPAVCNVGHYSSMLWATNYRQWLFRLPTVVYCNRDLDSARFWLVYLYRGFLVWVSVDASIKSWMRLISKRHILRDTNNGSIGNVYLD